jgi:hypothetical protein
MNGYITFYRGERYELRADSLYAAQLAAAAHFARKYPRRKVNGWDVNVGLAELAGEQVTHVAVD